MYRAALVVVASLLIMACNDTPFKAGTNFNIGKSIYKFELSGCGGYLIYEEITYQDGSKAWVRARSKLSE